MSTDVLLKSISIASCTVGVDPLLAMAAMFGCCTMMCMSGLSGWDRAWDSPPATMDTCSCSSFGTVMGKGRGLSSWAMAAASPLRERFSTLFFFE